MTTTTGSLLISCCLASVRAAAAAAATVAAAAAAAAATVVINARSVIVTIEQEGSKSSFGALGQCDGSAQADGLHCACCGSPGGGKGGRGLLFACHQS